MRHAPGPCTQQPAPDRASRHAGPTQHGMFTHSTPPPDQTCSQPVEGAEQQCAALQQHLQHPSPSRAAVPHASRSTAERAPQPAPTTPYTNIHAHTMRLRDCLAAAGREGNVACCLLLSTYPSAAARKAAAVCRSHDPSTQQLMASFLFNLPTHRLEFKQSR